MAANTGINGVLLTGISQINGITVTGTGSKNVAGTILNFGTSGGVVGTAYSVRLYGDPRSGGFEDPSIACEANKEGFPVNGGNLLYLDGFDSNLGQVTVFFDVALTTPFPGLNDNLYYYVDCRQEPRLNRMILLSQQETGNGWVLLDGQCR